MKSIRSLALLAATALTIGSFTAPVLAQTSTTSPAVKAEKNAAASKPLTATNYVTYVQAADLFEIESSRIAVQKAQNKEVRDYAQRVLDENLASSARLNSVARQSGVTITTPVLTVRQKTKLDELQKASLSSFDKAYILAQVDVHERELRLHNSYARNGEIVAVKTASGELVPAVRRNVSEAKRISAIVANERGGAS